MVAYDVNLIHMKERIRGYKRLWMKPVRETWLTWSFEIAGCSRESPQTVCCLKADLMAV